MNGGIILKLNSRRNFSEKEYADIIRAYNELVRENTRLKVQCQELLNENIKLREGIDKENTDSIGLKKICQTLLNENLKLIKEVDDVCTDTDDIK
jgi:hypothetical protein